MKFKFLALMAALTLVLAGCSSTDQSTTATTETTVSTTQAETAAAGSESATQDTSAVEYVGYTFTYGDVTIAMGAEAAELVEALGEPKNYFESESCAFDGLDKVYSYSGFKLNTYPVDDVDYVLSVVFSNDTVETDLGITIGSSREEVLAAYGDPTEELAAALVYDLDGTRITFGISNEAVATVEFSLITD